MTTVSMLMLSACGATARQEVRLPPQVPTTPALEATPVAETPPGTGKDRGRSVDPLVTRAKRAAARATEPIRQPSSSPSSTGRSGSGLVLGVMDRVSAPVGGPPSAPVTTAVANIPNRSSAAGFASSLRLLTAGRPDFVLLNEVSSRGLDSMRAIAPAYGAYRDPVPDRSLGGSQSMNNVVLWRDARWNLVDAGRVKVVDDDRGYRRGRPFVWDRYVTWAVLQHHHSGAVVSVVSTHLPTNPAKYPAQPGPSSVSRLSRYAKGMDRVIAVVKALSIFGPVLLGGDMNSHPQQGSWAAAARMREQGFGYAKDSGVMYLFNPPGSRLLEHQQVRIASDHPGLLVTVDLAEGVPPA